MRWGRKQTEIWMGWDGQEDRLTLHYQNPRVSHAPEVSSTTTRIIWWFEGLVGPHHYLQNTLSLQKPPDKILCHSFPTTLKGAARVWFSKLATSSINNFERLGNSFVCHFIGRQSQKILADHLLTIGKERGSPWCHMWSILPEKSTKRMTRYR